MSVCPYFPGARGPHDAEQEVLRRDRPRRVRQEPQGPRRARAAALHPRHQPQRPSPLRGERVNPWLYLCDVVKNKKK